MGLVTYLGRSLPRSPRPGPLPAMTHPRSLTPEEVTRAFDGPPDCLVDVGRGEVAYRRFGLGPDVVFVHGWPVSGATFRGLVAHLAPHLTCHVLDLVGTGDSRFGRDTPIDISGHIQAVRAVIDHLGLERYAVVGHDSGGLIARHAVALDARLRAMALIDTEQPQGLGWRFRQFLLMSRIPGFEHALGWAGMQRGLRRSRWMLGDCFTDRSLLDGDFERLFLAPLRQDPDRRWAAGELIRSFDVRYVREIADLHRRILVPVQLVWGERDPFFPLAWAKEMVETFPDARLHVVRGAKLFVHEEHPAEVAAAMLPVLSGRSA